MPIFGIGGIKGEHGSEREATTTIMPSTCMPLKARDVL